MADRFLIAEPSDTNALESFLARPWPHLARAFDEEDLGERLTGNFAVQVLDQAFATLEQDNRAVAGWGGLIAAHQAGALSTRDPRLTELLSHMDLAALVSEDEKLGFTATIWACEVARASDNEAFQAAIEQAVLASARRLAERYPSPLRRRQENDPAWHCVARVVEAATTLCRMARPEQVAVRLAELVPKVVFAWPSTHLCGGMLLSSLRGSFLSRPQGCSGLYCLSYVRDDWTRQALINEANRQYGRRPGGAR